MYFSRLTAVNEMSNPNKENYKRFRDFFLLEMCILVFNFVLFLHLLAHFYNTSFKKKSSESDISCGKYVSLISHLFCSAPPPLVPSPPHPRPHPPQLCFFISIWKWMICNQDCFFRITFTIHRFVFLGTSIFCMTCLKTSRLSFVVKVLFVVVILLNW